MKVSAWLCDYAEVSGGKLFVSGAGINLVATPATEPPHVIHIALACLVTIPWHTTNQPHTLTIELVGDAEDGQHRVALVENVPGTPDPAGLIEARFNVGRPPNLQPGDDSIMPIALPMMGLPLPGLGNYFFAVEIDGSEEERISFRLDALRPTLQVG